jgi:hypothetical protein
MQSRLSFALVLSSRARARTCAAPRALHDLTELFEESRARGASAICLVAALRSGVATRIERGTERELHLVQRA